MEGIHFPKWVNATSSGHHKLVSSSRMNLDKFCDIVDSILIAHPNFVLNWFMFLHLCPAVHSFSKCFRWLTCLEIQIDKPIFLLLVESNSYTYCTNSCYDRKISSNWFLIEFFQKLPLVTHFLYFGNLNLIFINNP